MDSYKREVCVIMQRLMKTVCPSDRKVSKNIHEDSLIYFRRLGVSPEKKSTTKFPPECVKWWGL